MKNKRTRLLVLFGLGLLFTLSALGYIRFYIARPIGSGPAGPAVARESFNQPWSERQVLLLGIGDSVTAGLGAKNSSHSYYQRLVKNPTDEFAELQGGYDAIRRIFLNSIISHSKLNPTRAAPD